MPSWVREQVLAVFARRGNRAPLQSTWVGYTADGRKVEVSDMLPAYPEGRRYYMNGKGVRTLRRHFMIQKTYTYTCLHGTWVQDMGALNAGMEFEPVLVFGLWTLDSWNLECASQVTSAKSQL